MALYGGRPAMDEHRIMRELKPQIVFATPGRLPVPARLVMVESL